MKVKILKETYINVLAKHNLIKEAVLLIEKEIEVRP